MFVSYSSLILISFLLFIGVFFYLFHMNLYKKFESIYEHQFAQVEKQLTNQKKFNWNDEEMAEVLSSLLNQSDHVVYIIDQSGEEIFVPDRKSARIPVLEEYLKEINEGN